MLCQLVEDLKGNSGGILKSDNGNCGNIGILGNASYKCLFHFNSLLYDSAGLAFKT